MAKTGYHSISAFATPERRHLISLVDRFEVCYYYRTHIHQLWLHEESVGHFFAVCCPVLLLYQVPHLAELIIQGDAVIDRPPSPDRSLARSPAIARPSPPPSDGLWPLSSLARRRSLARPPSFDRPPPLLSDFRTEFWRVECLFARRRKLTYTSAKYQVYVFLG